MPAAASGRAARRQPLSRGLVQVLLAEGLVLPAGIIAAAYLGRAFGPRLYGILAVALAIGDGIEWTLASLFSRATVQVVSEADDWGDVAASALRLQTAFGLAAGLLLWLFSDQIAAAVYEPGIAASLRLLGVEIPIIGAGAACRNVLTGRGLYRERAVASALRWFSRLFFVVLFVQRGFGIYGAVLSELLSSVVWLAVGLALARIPLAARGLSIGNARLWRFAVPLFVLALSLRVLDKIGLVALKGLGGSAIEAGWYAAAQNFAIALNLFALSFSPLLLGALAASTRGGHLDRGRPLVRNALRLLFGLVPFAALGAGAAPEVVRLVYGPGYEPAAQLAIPLLAAALGMAAVSIAGTILSAADQATRASRLVWPITVLAVVAIWFVAPVYGAMGTATVIGVSALVGAAIVIVAVHRHWQVSPPLGTCLRACAIGVTTLGAGLAWPVYGPWLVLKLILFGVGILAAFAALGEFSKEDVRLVQTITGLRTSQEEAPA